MNLLPTPPAGGPSAISLSICSCRIPGRPIAKSQLRFLDPHAIVLHACPVVSRLVDDYFQMSASIAEAKQQISCKTRDRPAGALAPFQAQAIGAVCNIPSLHARATM